MTKNQTEPARPADAEITPQQAKAEVQAVKKAMAGDRKSVPAMQAALDRWTARDGGCLPESLSTFHGLANQFADRFMGNGENPNLFNGEVVKREILQVAADVAGPNPTALERLLAERIALCHAHLQFLEGHYQNVLRDGGTTEQIEMLLARIDGAQRRELSAIKTLAQVRRLALPAVQITLPGAVQVGQVNVADQQINMATQASAVPA